jgi:hypothetical protein
MRDCRESICYLLSAIGYRLSAIGYRLSAICYRLFAIGYWLFAIGYWLLAICYWLLAIGYWLLAIGYWLLVRRDNESLALYLFLNLYRFRLSGSLPCIQRIPRCRIQTLCASPSLRLCAFAFSLLWPQKIRVY